MWWWGRNAVLFVYRHQSIDLDIWRYHDSDNSHSNAEPHTNTESHPDSKPDPDSKSHPDAEPHPHLALCQ